MEQAASAATGQRATSLARRLELFTLDGCVAYLTRRG